MRKYVFSIEVVHKLVLMYKLQLTHILVVQFSHSTQVRSSLLYMSMMPLTCFLVLPTSCGVSDLTESVQVSFGDLALLGHSSVLAFKVFSPQQQGQFHWKEHFFLMTHSLPHLCSVGPLFLVLSCLMVFSLLPILSLPSLFPLPVL